jgi:hypothetical protein
MCVYDPKIFSVYDQVVVDVYFCNPEQIRRRSIEDFAEEMNVVNVNSAIAVYVAYDRH